MKGKEIKRIFQNDGIIASDDIKQENLNLKKNNVSLYVVEKSSGRVEIRRLHNLVVNIGRSLLLQRLTGVPGVANDFTNLEVRYFAAGDGATSGNCTLPTPETATDTDLINKIAPLNTAPNLVGTYYLDLTNNLTYESENRLRFTITIDDSIYPPNTRLNEFGLFGGDTITNNFSLFARFTIGDIIISNSAIFIIDWWITLPVNLS